MNPLKFLKEDVKKDIQKLKDIREGKAKLISWDQLDFAGAMKDYWPWFLLLIAAFGAGFFFGSVMAHNDCVAVIKDKCPAAFINNYSIQEQTRANIDYEKYIMKNNEPAKIKSNYPKVTT